MKKMLFIIGLVAAIVFVPNVYAASAEPELVNIAGKNVFLANGTAVTIEATDVEGYGAVVKWGETGEMLVSADVTIFGGYHYNPTEKVDTNITMNGGTIKNIIGGGLHQSLVGTATVTINGGTITAQVQGGGYDGFVGYNNCEHDKPAHGTDAYNSEIRVDKTIVTVNGGTFTSEYSTVYGGGGGHSYTGEAEVIINDFGGTLVYAVAGGSNGYTGDSKVTINGGTITNLFSVNRGSMNSSVINVEGGEITNAYVGTLTANPDDPEIAKAAMNITGGSVENVSSGKNESDIAVLSYNTTSVTNVDTASFDDIDSVTATVTLTFNVLGEEESLEVPVGFSYTEEELEEIETQLTEYMKEKGYTYIGFYRDADYEKDIDLTKALSSNLTIYAKGEVIQVKEEVTPTPEEEPEKVNPDTSDINFIAIIATILIGSLGLGYTIKNRKFN